MVEPQRILRPFAQSLDLSFATKKNADLPDEYKDVGAKEARDALFELYDAAKPNGYNQRAKLTPKLRFCVSHILKKQKQGETLDLQERVFMASRPQSFVIRRKKFVHKKWVETMERTRNEIEDKLERTNITPAFADVRFARLRNWRRAYEFRSQKFLNFYIHFGVPKKFFRFSRVERGH